MNTYMNLTKKILNESEKILQILFYFKNANCRKSHTPDIISLKYSRL